VSALTDTRRSVRRRGAPCPSPNLLDGLGGEPTLDEVLSGAWEGLAAHRPVACPVCGEQMAPAYGAHARPIGGHCAGCQSTLS
jgi:hypothetical protein